MAYYSRELKTPVTRLDGLLNFVQMVINRLEAGEHHEALMVAVDLWDTLHGTANPFASITADKDNALIEEINRKHALEKADAIVRAHADGFAKGEQAEKARMAKVLGLAA